MKQDQVPSAAAYSVVVGCSRGLGAAMVDQLLRREGLVMGVARTRAEEIQQFPSWIASRRYRHLQLDIGKRDSVTSLKEEAAQFPPGPLVVIFNAACLLPEVKADGKINFEVLEEVNRTGISGFGNVLEAFENHFLQHGGTLVAISSINAFVPPVLDRMVAYPASKAYLQMAMRSLRFVWPNKVRLMTIHLGHIGNHHQGRLFHLLNPPTYTSVAKRIFQVLSRSRIPREKTYPFLYQIFYRFLLGWFPDPSYRKFLQFWLKLSGKIRK